ncbi:type VII secretion protein EccB [Corynebacterium sp. USCH3]|uniref:type VII secretion protein EccB n=1 Tax=Corynebacterium sp. USCH3 TaxID=3024840 RepID=UPI0030AE243D
MRTTGLQVSGYAFLLRRAELALVTGDARMAQDPLRTQRRAVGVGVLLTLLVTGGMLLVAMLRPQPSIDDAGLVADEAGTLHVRVGEVFHPVTNVASGRLLLGAADDVTTSTSEQLGRYGTGPALGIPDAPGLVPAPVSAWARCEHGVVAASSLPDAGAVVLEASSGMWLAVDGRRLLLPEGPVLARALGATPVPVAEDVLTVLERGPDVALTSLRHTVRAGDRVFLTGEDGVAEVTGARRAVAEALTPAPGAEGLPDLLSRPDVSGTAALTHVPADLDLADGTRMGEVCIGDHVVAAGALESDGVTVPVPGAHFGGPRGTSTVITERGFLLVSESGVRYSVTTADDLRVLGLPADGPGADGDEGPVSASVPYRVVAGLPDGGVLSEERASRTLVGGAVPPAPGV